MVFWRNDYLFIKPIKKLFLTNQLSPSNNDYRESICAKHLIYAGSRETKHFYDLIRI